MVENRTNQRGHKILRRMERAVLIRQGVLMRYGETVRGRPLTQKNYPLSERFPKSTAGLESLRVRLIKSGADPGRVRRVLDEYRREFKLG